MSEVTTTNANGALMSFIERAAVDPNFDVQKFGELLRLQRDVAHDQARRAFNVAMSQAQAEMLPVTRDARNSHLNNRYAKLETIDAAMRPIYTRHGFSVRYGSAPASTDGMIRITCTVAHDGGYFEEQYLDAPTGNAGSQGGRTATTPVQAVGSAITYLRRYLLAMVFNVVLADEDDDGEGQRRQAASSPKGRTAREWLDAFEVAMRDCASLGDVNRLISHPETQRAKESFANKPEAKQRMDRIIADGLAKHASIDDGDSASEDGFEDTSELAAG